MAKSQLAKLTLIGPDKPSLDGTFTYEHVLFYVIDEILHRPYDYLDLTRGFSKS